MTHSLRIALVGPCSSGKSSLAPKIKALGHEVRQVAQEHSYVQNMWQRISKPDILIYLDVNYAEARARRPYIDGGQRRIDEQHQRLEHALQHCDFYLDTSPLSQDEVAHQVLNFLQKNIH